MGINGKLYFFARAIGVFSQGLSHKPKKVSLDRRPEGKMIPGLPSPKKTTFCFNSSLYELTSNISALISLFIILLLSKTHYYIATNL